jgi:hypothetical protein
METKSEQKTLAQLEQFQDELTAQLETALSSENDIDPDLIISIRSRLNALPLKITAAKIAETKARLNEIHDELLTADENKRLIRSEQLERKNELNEQLELIQPFYTRYEDCSLRLSFIENDEALLRIARRESKALLFSLSDEIRK